MAKGILRSESLPLPRSIKADRSHLRPWRTFPLRVPSLYATKWNEAMVPQRAPSHLLFMRTSLEDAPNQVVAAVRSKAFRRHLLYSRGPCGSVRHGRENRMRREAMVRICFRRERKGLKRLEREEGLPGH
ncbi:hypothetical protein GWK47_018068 [Chionoecetes opilio]|uniref:Uncharacterized protein n=1 Tax=Chionoecetes opilio TaxID=41210 RepID=A0A8J5CLV1_CHIOP|nr:hypothetical protein GWK47_018068 [Chionoecetes opilio]